MRLLRDEADFHRFLSRFTNYERQRRLYRSHFATLHASTEPDMGAGATGESP